MFAVGDIAHFPDFATGEMTRIEHWNVASVRDVSLQLLLSSTRLLNLTTFLAQNHARTAAKTIAGKRDIYKKQALFWSAQGQQLRYVGTARSKKWEDVILQGEPDDLKFIAYYHGTSFATAAAFLFLYSC